MLSKHKRTESLIIDTITITELSFKKSSVISMAIHLYRVPALDSYLIVQIWSNYAKLSIETSKVQGG